MIIIKVYYSVCGPQMNGYVLAMNHEYQIQNDLIHSPPSDIHAIFATSLLWHGQWM